MVDSKSLEKPGTFSTELQRKECDSPEKYICQAPSLIDPDFEKPEPPTGPESPCQDGKCTSMEIFCNIDIFSKY